MADQDYDQSGKPITAAPVEYDANGKPIQSAAPPEADSFLGHLWNIAKTSTGDIGASAKDVLKTAQDAQGDPFKFVTLLGAQAGKAQLDQLKQSYDLAQQHRYVEAYGHGVAGLTPIFGPALANVAESVAKGTPEGSDEAVGHVLSTAAMTMAPEAKSAIAGKVASLADTAAEAGASRVARGITPEVGANKLRFGNMAQDVGPRLSTEPGMGAVTRGGFAENISGKLEDATAKLDQAADDRNAGRPIDTKPIIQALKAERDKLTAQPFNASAPERIENTRTSPIVDERGNPITVTTQTSAPVGKPTVPGPNATRAAQISQAIQEVSALGPQASYDALKTIRQAYDKVAKVKYAPSMTQDFLTKAGEASGAADVTGVLRSTLSAADPATAAANSEYAFWRKANDVVQAAEEVERARPTIGRSVVSRLAGAVAGGSSGGTVGAVVGAAVGPSLESAARSISGRIIVGRALGSLSEALRSGDATAITNALKLVRASTLPSQAPKDSGGSQ